MLSFLNDNPKVKAWKWVNYLLRMFVDEKITY